MWSKKRIMWFALMIFTIVVIFCFSDQTGEKSSAVGNTVVEVINNVQPNQSIDQVYTKLLFGLNLRKLAHVGLFALLGITVIGWTELWKQAIFICFLYSVLDEMHQYYVPGREAKVSDVIIDIVGFSVAIVLCEVIRKLQEKLTDGRNRACE